MVVGPLAFLSELRFLSCKMGISFPTLHGGQDELMESCPWHTVGGFVVLVSIFLSPNPETQFMIMMNVS